jgi:hypothetical protein
MTKLRKLVAVGAITIAASATAGVAYAATTGGGARGNSGVMGATYATSMMVGTETPMMNGTTSAPQGMNAAQCDEHHDQMPGRTGAMDQVHDRMMGGSTKGSGTSR